MNLDVTAPVSGSDAKRVCLLVVEDDLVDRKACLRSLTQQTAIIYDFTVADSGLEGLALLATERFDCILLDLHLPDMLGIEFIKHLQHQGNATPTIVLTGVNDLATAVDAMKHGVRDYLVKDGERHYLGLLPTTISRVLHEQALVEARKKAEEDQFRAQTQFRVLVEHVPAITYVAVGAQFNFDYVSPQIASFGFDRKDWLHNPDLFLRQIHDEDRERILKFFSTSDSGGKTRKVEYRLHNATGEIRWIRDKSRQVQDANGAALFIQGILIDITEDKQKQEELQAHRDRLEEMVAQRTTELESSNLRLKGEIFERQEIEKVLHEEKETAQITLSSIGDAVLTVDTEARIQFLNPVAEALLEWTQVHAVGQPLQTVCTAISESNQQSVEALINSIMQGQSEKLIKHHAILFRRHGKQAPISLSAAAIHSRAGNVVGSVLVVRDISQERQITDKLSYQATHDELTKLINRREFERRVGRAIETSQASKVHHALCFIDLDRFKAVNDTGGHAAGDELLRQLSLRLKTCMRQRDTLARIGGDEFAVLLEYCPLTQAAVRAEELRQVINQFRLHWRGVAHSVGASVGIMMLDGEGHDVVSVLKAADKACYQAKQAGRNCIQVYQPSALNPQVPMELLPWSNRLTEALMSDQLVLFCQSFTQLQYQQVQVTNCEILLRMRDGHGHLIPPSAFLPEAERNSLMPQVDRWVVRMLLQQVVTRGISAGDDNAIFWINLSAATLRDLEFPLFVQTCLSRSGVSPARLGFEISEATAIADLTATVTALETFRSLGVRLALDNVQGAFTTLDCLQTLPLDFIKFDGSLVQRLLSDPVAQVFVEAINRVAQEVLVVQTVAECVETNALVEMVRRLGLNHAQGFALSIPMALDDYLRVNLAGRSLALI